MKFVKFPAERLQILEALIHGFPYRYAPTIHKIAELFSDLKVEEDASEDQLLEHPDGEAKAPV